MLKLPIDTMTYKDEPPQKTYSSEVNGESQDFMNLLFTRLFRESKLTALCSGLTNAFGLYNSAPWFHYLPVRFHDLLL